MAAKKPAEKKTFNKDEGGARLSKSLRKHIRLLKSQGRAEEAATLRAAALANRKSAEAK
jgi:hypothetical protein